MTYILNLKLKTEKWQEDILNKRMEIGRQIYNACLGEILKRHNNMAKSNEFKQIKLMQKSKERNRYFTELNKKYKIKEYSLHDFVKYIQHHFKKNIDSNTAQKIATRAYIAFEKYMFHQAKKLRFKRFGELNSLEGKSNIAGIRFKNNQILWNGLIIPVIIKKNDIYSEYSLEKPIKYCRIKREMIKGKYHYYVQLILEGCPLKINRSTGEIKNSIGCGRVGIDIGTQTIAISSKKKIKLLELAPEINNIDREIKLINRYMDRSKRSMNCNKFNNNGTINIENKEKWIYSNKYIKAKNKRKELFRKQRELRKHSHNKLANYLIQLGNEFYVETMNYKGLQIRSKETIINKKTGKTNTRKRFGKSIANKAPSTFLLILDNKLKFKNNQLNKINTVSTRASQYNHITNEYIKKPLNERWNDYGEFRIQRDLYSAFLIMCIKENLKEVDRELCFREFDNFKKLHDKEIKRLKNNKRKISSMGI